MRPVRKDAQLAVGHTRFADPALSVTDSHTEKDAVNGEESQRGRRGWKGRELQGHPREGSSEETETHERLRRNRQKNKKTT